jgi:hypothetical protein
VGGLHTCIDSAHGIERVENFYVLHGSVVGNEVEGPGVGDGIGVAAGLEGVEDQEASDGAVCGDGDEGGAVDAAVAADGQEGGARAVGGARPAARVRRNGGERANKVGADDE